jgi:glycogen operon protein
LSGDEVINSQSGNNNPYCQDNEIGWVNFSNKKSAVKFREYVKAIIRFRKEHDILTKDTPMALNDYKHVGIPDLSYHGREPWIMGIGAEKKAIGIYYSGQYSKTKNKEDVMLLYNFYYDSEEFAAPKLSGKKKWYYVTNTADDTFLPADEPLKDQTKVIVPGGTVTILVGKEVSNE